MKIQIILGTLVSLGAIVGGLIVIDTHYAKSSEVAELSTYVCSVEERLNVKISQDRLNSLQERQWNLEDRYHDKAREMDEYRRLQQEKDSIIRDLKKGR